jgi:uncharacterized protein YaiE (UPF0345 family)
MSVNGNIAVPNGSSFMLGGAIGDTAIGKLYNVSGVLSLDGDGTRSIRFGSTTNGEVMRVDNTNQRIGIGTSSPSEKLEVSGKAIIRKSGSATAHGDTDLLVTDATAASSTAAIQILGGNAGFSNLQFSDTDSYSQGAIMYGHTDNYMAFKSNASERMRITSAGNVGIGTSSPEEKMSVSGSIQLTNQQELTWADIGDGNTGRVAIRGNEDNDWIMFKTDNSERMRLTNTGLGIGTTSPNMPLSIESSADFLAYFKSTDNKAFIGIADNDTTGFINVENTRMSIGAATGVNSNNLNIDLSNNRVGIGTSSPNRLLTLANTTGGGAYQAFNSTSNNNTTIGSDGTGAFIVYDDTASSYRMVVKASTGNVLIGTTTDSSARLKSLSANGNDFSLMLGRADTNNLWKFNHAGNDLRIYNEATSGSNIILGVDNGGTAEANNVLIGTATDNGNKLQVAGTASFVNSGNGQIDITRISGANTFIQSQSATGVIGTSTNHRLDLKTNGTTRATITSSGRLGIGTTSPSSPLTVSGRVDFQNDLRLRGTDSASNQGVTRFYVDSNNKFYIDTANDGSNLFAIDSSGQVTIPATPVATTDAASKSYVDSQVAEVGTSSFGSFTPTSTQSIASGGNVGVKSTLLLATSQVTASNITTSSAGLTFANAGLYQISFNFASKVSGTANRTLAAANLEYSTDGESWTEIVGSLVYNYDRGTATSGGASSWGFVYDGSASCSFIHNLATSSKIRARFWIEGRASSASGITTIINGCRLSAHKIG